MNARAVTTSPPSPFLPLSLVQPSGFLVCQANTCESVKEEREREREQEAGGFHSRGSLFALSSLLRPSSLCLLYDSLLRIG